MDRRHLRHADPGHHPGGADRARTDADLDPVDAGVDQGLGPGVRRDVAADDVDLGGGPFGLEPADHLEHALGVTVRGVDDEQVDALLDQGHRPLPGVAEEADRGADPEPALVVLGGVGVLVGLDEVLQGDQSLEPALLVDQRQLLDLVLGQQLHRVAAADPDRTGDQRHLGHHVADQPAGIVSRTACRGW